MSQKEFQRVKVIENAAGRRLSVREASRLPQLSERQVQRTEAPLSARFRRLGAARQSRTRHALGRCYSPEAVDLDLGSGRQSSAGGESPRLLASKRLRGSVADSATAR
jgi:hypothetical protein